MTESADKPHERGQSLDYRAPRDDPPLRMSAVGPFIGGMVIAFICIALLGLIWMNDLRLGIPPSARGGWVIRTPVVVFGLVGILAGLGCVATWRSNRRRYLILGMLFPSCIACLVEGLCYASG